VVRVLSDTMAVSVVTAAVRRNAGSGGSRTLTRMGVEAIDPFDDEQLRAAHDVTVADATARPYSFPWTWMEYRVAAQTPDRWATLHILLARDDDGTPVAVAETWMPQRDNTTMVWTEVSILPGRECAPVVAGLFDALADLVRSHGRSVIHTTATADIGGRTSPKQEALEAAGCTFVMAEAHRVLDLPFDGTLMQSLADEAAAHHRAYRLMSWRGPCPEAWIDGYADLRSRILVEAPDGGVGFEAEDYDAERIRHEEAELEAQQRIMQTTIAVHDDGALAGHSQLVVPETDPTNAFQWDTLVLADHRGHRLGLALKARNLLEAADAFDGRTLLHTWNAEGNTPMINVNERIGYRLVDCSNQLRWTL